MVFMSFSELFLREYAVWRVACRRGGLQINLQRSKRSRSETNTSDLYRLEKVYGIFYNFAAEDREEETDDELPVLSAPPSSFETVDFYDSQSDSISEESSITDDILEIPAGSDLNPLVEI